MTSKNHKEEDLSYHMGLNPLHPFKHILKEQKEDSGGTEEKKEEASDSESDQDSDTEEIIFDDTDQVKQEDTLSKIPILCPKMLSFLKIANLGDHGTDPTPLCCQENGLYNIEFFGYLSDDD